MQNFTRILFTLLLFCVFTTFLGCKNDDDAIPITVDPELPKVLSVSPGEGTVGTEISIKGSGFNKDASVKVGSQTATVVEVQSDTIIYAQVPAGIPANTLLPVSVTNPGGGNFTLQSAFMAVAPAIYFVNSATKPSGNTGSTIIIEGKAFGDVQGDGRVLFSDGAGGTVPAVISSPEDWTNTFIVTTVPQGAGNGPIMVQTVLGNSNTLPFMVTSSAVFSPSEIRWSLTAPLPVALSGHQAVYTPIDNAAGTTQQFVHITGGRNASAQAQTQVLFGRIGANGTVSAWNSTTALPEPLSAHATIAATPFNAKVNGSGYLYVIGGANAAGAPVTTVSFAALNEDGSVSTWNTTTPLPEPLHSLGAVIFRSAIYISGGATSGNSPVAKVYKAEIDTLGRLSSWKEQPSLPSARAYHGFATFGGYLYAVGGETGSVAPDNANYQSNDSKLGEVAFAKINIRTGDISESGWVLNESSLQKSRTKHTTLVAGGNILVSSGLYAAAGQGSSENTYAQIFSDGRVGSFGGATGSNTLSSAGGNNLFNQAGISYTDANGVARVMIIGGDDVNSPGNKQTDVLYY